MKQFWLVRHGQSEGNIDKPQPYRGAPPLTPLGWQQVQTFADNFEATPDLIVSSDFIRAQQSAEPLQARFPHVPTETWPVQEFTPLAKRYYEGVKMSSRRDAFLQFFSDADPNVDNGEGAESFTMGLQRAADLLIRLQTIPQQTIVVYSHATFLRLVYWAWLYGDVSRAATGMTAFGMLLHSHKIPNTAFIHGVIELGKLHLSNIQTEHVHG